MNETRNHHILPGITVQSIDEISLKLSGTIEDFVKSGIIESAESKDAHIQSKILNYGSSSGLQVIADVIDPDNIIVTVPRTEIYCRHLLACIVQAHHNALRSLFYGHAPGLGSVCFLRFENKGSYLAADNALDILYQLSLDIYKGIGITMLGCNRYDIPGSEDEQ